MNFFFFGLLGGVIRGILGIVKHTQSYKDVKVSPKYFGATVGFAGLVGLVSAWVVQDLGVSFMGLETLPLSLALIIGYAGGDFLENIFKIITKNENIFEVGKIEKKK